MILILNMFWYNATNYHLACTTAGMLIIMFETMKRAVFTLLRKGINSNIMSFINSDSWTIDCWKNLFNLGIVVALLIYFKKSPKLAKKYKKILRTSPKTRGAPLFSDPGSATALANDKKWQAIFTSILDILQIQSCISDGSTIFSSPWIIWIIHINYEAWNSVPASSNIMYRWE